MKALLDRYWNMVQFRSVDHKVAVWAIGRGVTPIGATPDPDNGDLGKVVVTVRDRRGDEWSRTFMPHFGRYDLHHRLEEILDAVELVKIFEGSGFLTRNRAPTTGAFARAA